MPRKKLTMKKYLITLQENQVSAIDAYALMLDLDRSFIITSMLGKALLNKEIMDEFTPPRHSLVKRLDSFFLMIGENGTKQFLEIIGMSKDELVRKFGEVYGQGQKKGTGFERP